jgi:hypothetical protein
VLVECDTCRVRDRECGQCVVTALLGAPSRGAVDIGERESRALALLARAGMVAPLRLSPPSARIVSGYGLKAVEEMKKAYKSG